jgi:hypothetical protein
MFASIWKKTGIKDLTLGSCKSLREEPVDSQTEVSGEEVSLETNLDSSASPQDHSQPTRMMGPTHPYSPDVLSEFPPFECYAASVLQGIHSLQTTDDLEINPQNLDQNPLPPNPEVGRKTSNKKGRPPPLTISKVLPYEQIEQCRGPVSEKQFW